MHHPDYQSISRRFRQRDSWSDDEPLEFPEENIDLFYLNFESHGTHVLLGRDGYVCKEHGLTFPAEPTQQSPPDHVVSENARFRYPLVRDHAAPGHRKKFDRALVILHGLNERSFTKYIPWAYQFWKCLGAPVILFPLSFHINRVNPDWLHEQKENYARRRALPMNENVHRFNAVISDRLGSHPERFFWGAIQSYWDLVDLVSEIRSGRHPHFDAAARIDLLGFSAGGFVALALLLENTRNLFADSRGILFSTCAAMRDISLSSYLIVDQMAEISLMNLFVKYQRKLANARLKHWLEKHPEGTWFNSFCGLMPDRARLAERLQEIAPRLLGIANANDQVIPAGAVFNALQGIRRESGVRVEELPLGIHENPFVTSSYNPGDRTIITDSLNFAQFGGIFEEFIRISACHLRG